MQESYFTSTCRICFNKDNIMINMLDTTEFDKTVLELSEQCGDVQFDSDDAYEKLICEECANELYLAAKFRQKCQDSKLKYNKILNAIKQKLNGEALYIESQEYNEQINSLEIFNDNVEVDVEVGVQELEELQQKDADDEEQEIISVTHFTVINDIIKQEFQTNEPIHDELQYEDIEYLDNNTLPDCNNGRPTQYVVIEENITTSEPECYNESVSDTNTIIDENDVDNDIDDNNEEEMNDKIISTDNNISNQIKFIESIECNWENINENQIGKRYTRNTSVIINHKCNVCGAGFAKLQNLQRHLTTHVSVVSFGCKYCQEIFTSEKLYKNHEKNHVNGCDKVEQFVINKMKIKSKKINIIKDKKTHKCGFCDKSFISNSMLHTHIRTHTGERPFRCETCCKTFTTQGGLDLHNRRHTGYKPFKCEYCDRAFVESSNLKVHLRIHTGEKPHKCTTCGRSFSRVFLLQIHQRTHTGEKPFICPHTSCSKAFAQQGDLAAHKRLHSGERPHKCHICDKGFIKSSGLISHLKRHTKCNAENNAFIDDIIEHDDNFTIIEQD